MLTKVLPYYQRVMQEIRGAIETDSLDSYAAAFSSKQYIEECIL